MLLWLVVVLAVVLWGVYWLTVVVVALRLGAWVLCRRAGIAALRYGGVRLACELAALLAVWWFRVHPLVAYGVLVGVIVAEVVARSDAIVTDRKQTAPQPQVRTTHN